MDITYMVTEFGFFIDHNLKVSKDQPLYLKKYYNYYFVFNSTSLLCINVNFIFCFYILRKVFKI